MIIQFKDRKSETAELKNVLSSNKFEFIIIYGRRRIGKTELVLHATKNKKRVYYLATETNNLNRFYQTCINYDKEISKLRKDWEILFEYLKDKTDTIIIDEFQNLIKEDKNIVSLFQSIVDTKLKDSKLKLFILGSSVSIITSKVLSYKSPLYGRRSGSINLKAISFSDLKEFFPKINFGKLVEIYGFADGIPYYLIKIDGEFWHWLESEIKQQKTFLKDEIDFIVRYEFENANTYKLLLEAIANGKTKINEIKDFIKAERTDVSPYLKNLIDIGFVKREVPITENINSRLGRYYLSDNFLKFWFSYIYPNLSAIEENIFSIEKIKNNYNSYLGFVFEQICRQFIIKLKPFNFTKIGRWWYKDTEIDLVALNEQENKIAFIECKWQDNVNPEEVLTALKEKIKQVKWKNEKRKESYCIIAKSFTKKVNQDNLILYNLKDLEKAL